MQLNLVARYMSGVTPLSPPPVLMAYKCTSSTLSRVLSLYTAKLTAVFRNAESDFLTDNRNALLCHMDGVNSGLFYREEVLAVTNLRRYIHHIMEGVQEFCEGLVIHHCIGVMENSWRKEQGYER